MKVKKIFLFVLILVTVFSIFTLSISASEFSIGPESDRLNRLKEGYYSFDTNSSSRPLDFSYFDFNSNNEYYFNFPFYVTLTLEGVGVALLYCDSMQVYYSASSDDGYEIYVRSVGISSINAVDDTSYDVIEGYCNGIIGNYVNMYRSIQGFTNYITTLGTWGTTTEIFLPNSVYAPSNFYSFFSNCSYHNQSPYDYLVPGSYEFVIPENLSLSSNYVFEFEFTCDNLSFFDSISIETENNIVRAIYYSNSISGDSIPVYRGGIENPDKIFQRPEYQYIKPLNIYTLINNNTFGSIQTLTQFLTYKPYYVNPGYQISQEAYADGFNYGHSQGYQEGYIVGEEEGYVDGYDVGFEDGQEDSITSGFFLGIITTLDSLSIGPISVFDIIITLLGLFVLGWILKLIAGG